MDSALEFNVTHKCGRKSRVGKLKLPHCVVNTPVFMPVGTQGTIKSLTSSQVTDIGCEIILGNTYHLSQRPGIEVLSKCGGLHNFMNWKNCLLTDSGGFQMVSLLQLCDIDEKGVRFQSPHDGSEMLLTPEKSMEIQNIIGADIMMALDDVVSSLTVGPRVKEAMERSIRWLDRCIKAHKRPKEQNLFGIIQGGLDPSLRKQCLEAMIKRDLPGYAIGGLSGGEKKEDFWRIVNLCTDYLPEKKPRYSMGVGYPVDMVVCVALGVDMFDCVYPCRTARFGTVLTEEGPLTLKKSEFRDDHGKISGVDCLANHLYTRSFFQRAKVSKDVPVVSTMLTQHNIKYMMDLMKTVREEIKKNRFPAWVKEFMKKQFPREEYPKWVVDALSTVNINLVRS